MQHNLGLGGAVVVALYRKGFTTTGANTVSAQSTEGFKVHKYMQILQQVMQDDTDNLIEKVRGIYGFKVRNGPDGAEAYWVINAKEGRGSVTLNGKEKTDVMFTVNDVDTVDLIIGKLNPQKAFFQGKIKIQGNMGLALKLTELLNVAGSKIADIRSKL